MAPYSSPAPSFRSIQYRAPMRSLVLNWASAQLFPAFSSPSRRMQGHGTRPVGLRVLRPAMAMMCSLPTWGRCRPESYGRGTTEIGAPRKSIAGLSRRRRSGGRIGVSTALGAIVRPAGPAAQAVRERGVPAARAGRPHGLGQRPLRADEDDELLGPGDGGVEQVALQHRPRAGGQRDDDARVLAALRPVHRDRVGVHQLVELAEVVVDRLVLVGDDGERLLDGVDRGDQALRAVEDAARALVVVVADLADLVADAEHPPAEVLLPTVGPGGGERLLQQLVERGRAGRPTVHRGEHLDVATGVEPEARGDAAHDDV